MADYKALAQQMYDSMAPGVDVDAMVERFMAEDFVEGETIPGTDATRETPRQLFKMLFAAFPDFRVTVHDMLQDGDKVASRVASRVASLVTFSGTHQGDFMGIPAAVTGSSGPSSTSCSSATTGPSPIGASWTWLARWPYGGSTRVVRDPADAHRAGGRRPRTRTAPPENQSTHLPRGGRRNIPGAAEPGQAIRPRDV